MKIRDAWPLVKRSAKLLRENPILLWFPVVFGAAGLATMAAGLASFVAIVNMPAMQDASEATKTIAGGSLVFLVHFIVAFFVTSSRAAVISQADLILGKKGDPSVGAGFAAVATNVTALSGWSVVVAVVTFLTSTARRREGNFNVIAGITAQAWGVVTFLVIPFIVLEQRGPIDAARTSLERFRNSWGTQVAGSLGFGFLTVLGSIAGIIPLVYGLSFINGWAGWAAALVWVFVVSMVVFVFESIFQTALYRSLVQGDPEASDFAGTDRIREFALAH